jgi:hypothetical protein
MDLLDRLRMHPLVTRRGARSPGRLILAHDAEAHRVLMPEYVKELSWSRRLDWLDEHGLEPVVGGGTNYSWLQMQQPYQATDGVAVTAAANTTLSQDTFFTLPANFFAFVGQVLWFHAWGKQSNVVTTPGTYTFIERYAGIAGTILASSGAIVPNPVAVTDNLWLLDLYVQALAVGQLTTSLTLLSHGRVSLANKDASLASDQAEFMPAGGTSLANVTSLNGTIAQALNLSVTPSVATGSITQRGGWIVAMN